MFLNPLKVSLATFQVSWKTVPEWGPSTQETSRTQLNTATSPWADERSIRHPGMCGTGDTSPSDREEPHCTSTCRLKFPTWSQFAVEQAASEACRGWFSKIGSYFCLLITSLAATVLWYTAPTAAAEWECQRCLQAVVARAWSNFPFTRFARVEW